MAPNFNIKNFELTPRFNNGQGGVSLTLKQSQASPDPDAENDSDGDVMACSSEISTFLSRTQALQLAANVARASHPGNTDDQIICRFASIILGRCINRVSELT